MKKYKRVLIIAGILSFVVALFQAIIGFSPTLSLYFGAPEALVTNIYVLIIVSLLISGIFVLFGLYGLSGAGYIRTLPWLKQTLAAISCILILRGVLIIPEFLVVIGVLNVSFPVEPRFAVFSFVPLLIGLLYMTGTIRGWHAFTLNGKAVGR
ncbi:MAG: hypothetical protein GY874_08540 [Desulfobacteraceae bacterium]|nr:hypothetical protein [Desulfobacteraceae bacterium]